MCVGCRGVRLKGVWADGSFGCRVCVGCGGVYYTHLLDHETPEHRVCCLLLEKKNHAILTTVDTSDL